MKKALGGMRLDEAYSHAADAKLYRLTVSFVPPSPSTAVQVAACDTFVDFRTDMTAEEVASALRSLAERVSRP